MVSWVLIVAMNEEQCDIFLMLFLHSCRSISKNMKIQLSVWTSTSNFH